MTLTDKVDKLFTEWNKPDSPGCAIAVIQDGQVIYSRGYGMANLKHDIPISTTSVFNIASISKQFTAISVALLARQSRLSLDDEIQTYFPEIRHYERPITIRHLIHHTSGLRDYIGLMNLSGLSKKKHCSIEEIISLISLQQELNFQPGTEHLYSNTGYFLLGEIVKRVSGKSLRVFADEHIFTPLGMKNTYFRDDFREIVQHLAIGYSPKNSKSFQIQMSLLDLVGDGGIHTNIEDLCLWDANFYHNIIGGYGQDLIEEISTPGKIDNGEVLDYAFGLILGSQSGLRMISHSGSWAGYRSEAIRFPEQRFSVICLSNLNSINPSRLARQISEIYLAEKFTRSKEKLSHGERQFIELSTAELKTKTGSYFNVKSGANWELTMDAEKLMVDAAGFKFQIMPIGSEASGQANRDLYHSVGIPYDLSIEFQQQKLPSSLMMSYRVESGKPTLLERFNPYTPNLELLADYSGDYFCEELGVKYRLSIEGSQLVISRASFNLLPDYLKPLVLLTHSLIPIFLTIAKLTSIEFLPFSNFFHALIQQRSLKPLSHNLFWRPGSFFEFICNGRGRVIGFNLNTCIGRVRSIHFIKQESNEQSYKDLR
jgi:CubicO group peptidase (beta-lactamase class C family)